MSRYIVSPRAQADIEEIWNYTAKTWGVDQAEAYVRALQAAIETVAEEPRKGRACRRGPQGISQVPGRLAHDRSARSGIDIVRILHSRMDFERHV